MITDCHIHIQPLDMFKPAALELMKRKRANYDQIVEYCASPKAFLKYLDQSGIDRAVLINYVAPEVIGLHRKLISSSPITRARIPSGCFPAAACIHGTAPISSRTWSRSCGSAYA